MLIDLLIIERHLFVGCVNAAWDTTSIAKPFKSQTGLSIDFQLVVPLKRVFHN